MVLSKLFLALSLCVIVEIGLSVPTDADAVRDKRWDSCPHPGCKGSKGARGDRGPMGPMGYVGLRGPPGYCDPKVCYDFVHDHLPKGGPIQSDPGDPGLPGPKGDPGPPGPQGFSGLPGRDGADGPPGPRGPIGPPGKNGIDGEDGADGIPGTHGKDGDPGSKGLPGMKGMPGEPGAPGDPGSKGIPGDDGDTGPKGDKGDPGMQGRKGVPGVDGTPGEKGNPGSKGIPGLPGADGQKGEQGQDGKDGMKGGRGPPGPPIDVIPIGDSESCTKELQGVIRFDPITAQLYFCNGTQWICIVSQQCGGGPTCPSPFGQQNLGDEWYQIFTRNVTLETQDAADIVLLIDDSGSMNREHEWLLAMVPNLEAMLVQAGVGDGAEPNRYCAISFGGFGDRTMASFLLPEPNHCFSADRFPEARAQLKNSGITEDGYQAIDFAIRNVPFRKSPFIAKNILLVTDEGRHVLPIAENITREVIKGELMDNDILLNVVVWAFLNLTNGDTDAVVMGQNASITYIVEPNGAFSTTTNEAIVTSSETNTVTAYFDLALEVGGASWSLPVLRESSATSNIPLQQSFTNALTELKVQEIKTAIESCRRCVCASPDGGLTAEVICSSADNQEFCKCVANSSTGREADCLGLGRRRR